MPIQEDGVPVGLVHVEPRQDVLRVLRPQGDGQLRLAFHREQGAAIVVLVLRVGLAEGGEQLAANIDRSIGKATAQEDALEPGQETTPATAEKPRMADFKPYVGRKRRSGTGCVSEINDHLFEGRYSPKWPDGKKHARNVYAHTREECEEKLKVLIVEMKAEIAETQRLKNLGEGDGSPLNPPKKLKKAKKTKKKSKSTKKWK